MKLRSTLSFLALLLSFASTVAHAGLDDERRVYDALPGYGVDIDVNGPKTTQKEVGGLRCRELKTLISVEGSGYIVDYECRLKWRGRNDAAIYNAIGVPAKRGASASKDEIVDVKSVGNLTCRRYQSIASGRVSYACKLKTSWFF
jgi:hypothetical protein